MIGSPDGLPEYRNSRNERTKRMGDFLDRAKNLALAIILWAVIGVGVLELGGFIYVNFFQHDANAPINPPDVSKAQYEVYVKANNRVLFSNDVEQSGTIITLDGYYALVGDKFRYSKLPLTLDEKYFGDIEVIKR